MKHFKKILIFALMYTINTQANTMDTMDSQNQCEILKTIPDAKIYPMNVDDTNIELVSGKIYDNCFECSNKKEEKTSNNCVDINRGKKYQEKQFKKIKGINFKKKNLQVCPDLTEEEISKKIY